MENIDQAHFNIIHKIELDCRKTGPENAILRYEIKAQCERIRQTRSPLPSKCYILHAIVLDLVSKTPDSIKAVRLSGLVEELSTPKIHCQLFHGTVEELLILCSQLDKLNLLLVLRNKYCVDDSWIVADSYRFLCQIEAAVFPQADDQTDPVDEYSVVPNINGVIVDSKIKEKFSRMYPEVPADLLIMLMIHYKYCEEVMTKDNETAYFFPHLLKPILDIPQWEKEEGRFMFAWTLAPESRYHYFMPHLVHHFLLQLSQAEELGITNLERATRTLVWGDPSGVEVVVHIHSSQRLIVSMRSTPHHQLQCLRLRKPVLRKIKEIIKALSPSIGVEVVESFVPLQRRVTLPYIDEDLIKKGKVRLYKKESIKIVIANKEASVPPSNHATPLVSIEDLLFFEPYYYMEHSMRQRLYQSPDECVTESDYYDICTCLGSVRLRLLDELLDNVEQPADTLQDQIQQSYLRLMAQHGVMTCGQLRELLDSISFFELETIFGDSS